MDGCLDGLMEGGTDGRTDGWKEGWMKWMDSLADMQAGGRLLTRKVI